MSVVLFSRETTKQFRHLWAGYMQARPAAGGMPGRSDPMIEHPCSAMKIVQ